ncbi:MAG TPA: class E sortase [Micromonosporaceae bacterium]
MSTDPNSAPPSGRHHAPDADDATAVIPRLIELSAAVQSLVMRTDSAAAREEPSAEAEHRATILVRPFVPVNDASTVIRTPPASDDTTVLPVVPDADETTVLPAVPLGNPAPAPAAADGYDDGGPGAAAAADAHNKTAPEAPAPTQRRWGAQIVPLRAVRTSDGYRSVHSELTRTTVGTIVRATVRGFGEAMITFGLVILMFAAYEVWGKTAIIDAHQEDMNRALSQVWDEPTGPTVGPTPTRGANPLAPPPGKAVARLHIPRLHKEWVVVQGVAPRDIRYAPGHYPGTAMPGQAGNFSIAGHRIPAIFWNLDDMRSGDKVVVETRDHWYVYEVTHVVVVKPTAIEVVSPVPPGESPGNLITLTTCNPKFDNYQRLIVHGTLLDDQPRSAGPPSALEG